MEIVILNVIIEKMAKTFLTFFNNANKLRQRKLRGI